MTDSCLARRRVQKNTATRRSPTFSGETLIWDVTSSPHAFSAQAYCVTTCTSPHVFFPFSLLSLAPFPPIYPANSRTNTQLPERNPRTAPSGPAPRPARHARPRRALRRRPDLRRDLDLVARHYGHVPGRLFRHLDGLPRRGLPVQRAPRSDVRRQHDVFCRDGFVVRYWIMHAFLRSCACGNVANCFIFCRYERPVGLLITLYVYIVYTIALKFEGCAIFFPSLSRAHC